MRWILMLLVTTGFLLAGCEMEDDDVGDELEQSAEEVGEAAEEAGEETEEAMD